MVYHTDIHLSTAQKALLTPVKPVDVTLVQGGWSSGKTFTSCYMALKLAMAHPNSTGLIVTRQVARLRDNIWPLLQKQLSYLKPGRDYWYNQQTRVLRFPNGSKIYLRALNRSKTYAVIQANWIWVEQADEATEDQFLQLLQQLTQPGLKRLWLTSRPVALPPPDAAVKAVDVKSIQPKKSTDRAEAHWLTQYFGPAAPANMPYRRLTWHTHDNPTVTSPRQYAHLSALPEAHRDSLLAGVHPSEAVWLQHHPICLGKPLTAYWHNIGRKMSQRRLDRLNISNGGWLAPFAYGVPNYRITYVSSQKLSV